MDRKFWRVLVPSYHSWQALRQWHHLSETAILSSFSFIAPVRPLRLPGIGLSGGTGPFRVSVWSKHPPTHPPATRRRHLSKYFRPAQDGVGWHDCGPDIIIIVLPGARSWNHRGLIRHHAPNPYRRGTRGHCGIISVHLSARPPPPPSYHSPCPRPPGDPDHRPARHPGPVGPRHLSPPAWAGASAPCIRIARRRPSPLPPSIIAIESSSSHSPPSPSSPHRPGARPRQAQAPAPAPTRPRPPGTRRQGAMIWHQSPQAARHQGSSSSSSSSPRLPASSSRLSRQRPAVTVGPGPRDHLSTPHRRPLRHWPGRHYCRPLPHCTGRTGGARHHQHPSSGRVRVPPRTPHGLVSRIIIALAAAPAKFGNNYWADILRHGYLVGTPSHSQPLYRASFQTVH